MAQRIQTIMTSDLSGVDIPEGDGTTVRFSAHGVDYELDVTSKEAQQFDSDLQVYIGGARKVGGRRTSTAPTTSGRDKSQTQAIKRWADEQGIDYPKRGRLPQSLLEAYENHHR